VSNHLIATLFIERRAATTGARAGNQLTTADGILNLPLRI
jgi:hypothetical protein